MRRNSNRPSVAILIAALALAACQSTPAAPPTQTPVNPKDTFVTPGAPTPFLPTMTPAPSPTVRPTATAVPPTVTIPLPTLAPTRVGTPTPTPVIVNGQPKMWWVDQMVKQADGSYMAPEAVRQAIREMAEGFFLRRAALNGQDSLVKAKEIVSNVVSLSNEFLIGELRDAGISAPAPRVNVMVSGTIHAVDVRAFGADGVTAFVAVEHAANKMDVYDTSTWAVTSKGLLLPDFLDIWQSRYDPTDGRWKLEKLIATERK